MLLRNSIYFYWEMDFFHSDSFEFTEKVSVKTFLYQLKSSGVEGFYSSL